MKVEVFIFGGQIIDKKRKKGWGKARGNEEVRREDREREQREDRERKKRERDKWELRRQFEKEEGLKEIKKQFHMDK